MTAPAYENSTQLRFAMGTSADLLIGKYALQQDFHASAGRATIHGVLAGTNRTVTLQGLDLEGIAIFEGSVTDITINTGHPDLDTTDKLKEHFMKYSKQSSKNPIFIGAELLQGPKVA